MKQTKTKEKIADVVVVVAAWAIVLALVYITILKFKTLLH
jgi:hypothetical protein